MTDAARPSEGASRAHEPNTANVRGIWWTTAGLLIALAVVSLGVWYLLGGYRAEHPDVPPPTAYPQSAESMLHWESPNADLRRYHQRQHGLLHEYAWQDRASGVVRVPIERAMDLVVRQGWQTRREADTAAARPTEWEAASRVESEVTP